MYKKKVFISRCVQVFCNKYQPVQNAYLSKIVFAEHFRPQIILLVGMFTGIDRYAAVKLVIICHAFKN